MALFLIAGLIGGFLASYAIYQPQIQNLQTQLQEQENQLEAHQTQIKEQQNIIEGFKIQVREYHEEVRKLNSQIQSLQAEIESLHKENTQLKTQIKELNTELIETRRKALHLSRLLSMTEQEYFINLLRKNILQNEYNQMKAEGLTDEEILKKIVAEWQISPELLKANWKQISGHYY
jgi:cell division protein FtsB